MRYNRTSISNQLGIYKKKVLEKDLSQDEGT